MNYSEFINELKPLLEEARTLFDEKDTHQNARFRKWRHQLTTTINIIENQGYWIDCDIESRIFQVASYGSVSEQEQIAQYNQELQDTINELEIIIQHFTKYGDPQAKDRGDSNTEPMVNKVMADVSQDGQSLKEKFESHPVIWGLSLIILGFLSGFAVRPYLIIEASREPPMQAINCAVVGVDKIEESHNMRMKTLQNQLMKLETSASDHSLISSDQREYKESADRVRQDIVIENASYKETIQTLSKTCQ